MFKRLLLDDSTTLFTVIAFIVTAAIFLSFLWRALRMKRSQVEHFENIPFSEEKHTSRHDA